jgi:hypothetical protein
MTVSGAVLNNVLSSELSGIIDPDILAQITSSVFDLPNLNLSGEEQILVLAVYMRGIQAVFALYACLIGISFVASMFVVDRGLAEKEEETSNDTGRITGNNYGSIEPSRDGESARII